MLLLVVSYLYILKRDSICKQMGYSGHTSGLYRYIADNSNVVRNMLGLFFDLSSRDVKVSYRMEDLEIMVFANIEQNGKHGKMSVLSVNRLDEYKFYYQSRALVESIMGAHRSHMIAMKLKKIAGKIQNV